MYINPKTMIVALMPVRNEAWCVGLTLRALLLWVDKVVALEHASTDATGDILAEIQRENPERMVTILEENPVWEEMRHRQTMLDMARFLGATHIVMVDADEILTGPIGEMHELVNMLPRNVLLQLFWICLDAPGRYYSSGMWSEQRASIAFRDFPDCHWAARDGYDFHHRQPMGVQWQSMFTRGSGGLMHLQFLNKRRLKAKQYLYQLTERLRWPDRESVLAVRQRYAATVEAALAGDTKECPPSWWEPYAHLMQHLHLDENAVTWQELECAKILRENPGIEHGLDSFGLFQ